MSERARHLLHVEHLTRGVLNSPCGHDEIYGGNNNRALRDKKASSLNAIIDSDISAARAFGLSDVCDEVFGNVDALQQFQFGHARPPAVALCDHAIAEPYVTEIRRGVAPCIKPEQVAS